jgi:hypothetical protein
MNKSAFSLFVFSIYMFILGSLLVVIPNVLLSLFNVAETHEVWIRVAGMLILIIGFLDFMAARNELLLYIRWTVFGRLAVAVFLITFVVLGLAPPILIWFGVIDALGAIWTLVSLRRDRGSSTFLVD